MACPICNRPTEAAWRPFCSRRCADVDLGRWLTGGYAIPARDDDGSPPAGDGRGSPTDPPHRH